MNETQRKGNGSSKLIWHLPLQNVSLKRVSWDDHMMLLVALALTRTNEGKVVWLLSCSDGHVIVLALLSNFLGNLAVGLLVRSVPHFSLGAQWAVYLSIVVCSNFFCHLTIVLVCVIACSGDGPNQLLQTRQALMGG